MRFFRCRKILMSSQLIIDSMSDFWTILFKVGIILYSKVKILTLFSVGEMLLIMCGSLAQSVEQMTLDI